MSSGEGRMLSGVDGRHGRKESGAGSSGKAVQEVEGVESRKRDRAEHRSQADA